MNRLTMTLNLVSAGITSGAAASATYTTTTTTAGLINGKFVTTLAPQTDAASPTTDANTGAAFNALSPNKTCVLVYGQTAAGAIRLVQGPIIDTFVGVTTTVGAFKEAPQFPGLPDNFLPLGYTLVRTAPAASPWTPGTSFWNASGVSNTAFQNIGVLPVRPQIA
jgi:hypothetical protein